MGARRVWGHEGGEQGGTPRLRPMRVTSVITGYENCLIMVLLIASIDLLFKMIRVLHMLGF